MHAGNRPLVTVEDDGNVDHSHVRDDSVVIDLDERLGVLEPIGTPSPRPLNGAREACPDRAEEIDRPDAQRFVVRIGHFFKSILCGSDLRL